MRYIFIWIGNLLRTLKKNGIFEKMRIPLCVTASIFVMPIVILLYILTQTWMFDFRCKKLATPITILKETFDFLKSSWESIIWSNILLIVAIFILAII